MEAVATQPPALIDDILTFDDILAGQAGPREAEAAREWLARGGPMEPLPRDLVVTIGARAYLDTRIGPDPTDPGSMDSKSRPSQPSRDGARKSQAKAAPRKFVAHRNGPSPGRPTPRPLPPPVPDSEGVSSGSKRMRDGSPTTPAGKPEGKTTPAAPAALSPVARGAKPDGMEDLSAAPGWSFKLSMYNQPMFISPEGLCCSDWDEVRGGRCPPGLARAFGRAACGGLETGKRGGERGSLGFAYAFLAGQARRQGVGGGGHCVPRSVRAHACAGGPPGRRCRAWGGLVEIPGPRKPPPQVKAFVRSTRRIAGLSNAMLLQWLREIATGQWAGRSTHPASLARMVAMQRWRACTFSGEREACALRAASAKDAGDAVDLTG